MPKSYVKTLIDLDYPYDVGMVVTICTYIDRCLNDTDWLTRNAIGEKGKRRWEFTGISDAKPNDLREVARLYTEAKWPRTLIESTSDPYQEWTWRITLFEYLEAPHG